MEGCGRKEWPPRRRRSSIGHYKSASRGHKKAVARNQRQDGEVTDDGYDSGYGSWVRVPATTTAEDVAREGAIFEESTRTYPMLAYNSYSLRVRCGYLSGLLAVHVCDF